MSKVSLRNTSFSSAQAFAKAVHAAFMRAGLSSSAAAIATAHVSVSTGWGKSIHNYSLAGIKAGPKEACYGQPSKATYSGNWFCACSWEFTTAGQQVAGCSDCSDKYGNPRCKYPFRAYSSLDEGARAVLGILKASRYAKALAYLKAGNTAYFAEVGRAGWYTSNVEQTAASMKKNHAQILTYLGMPAPSSAGGGIGTVALGIGLYMIWKYFA